MSGIPDLDQYGMQRPSFVTFEPGTLNLEPISLGYNGVIGNSNGIFRLF
jgi:hypothetical protein